METTFKRAIQRLATGNGTEQDAALVANEVAPLCYGVTDGSTGETVLADWIWEGARQAGISGDETPQSIAAEWNELTKQATGEA